MKTVQDLMAEIASSLQRGRGKFALVRTPGFEDTASLMLGAPTCIKMTGGAYGGLKRGGIGNGFVVTLGLSRAQVEALRNACDEFLKVGT